jgi:hypothetical protein
MSRKKLITIIAVCIVVLIVAVAISLSKGDPVVSFTDAGLETAIREALNKTAEPIYVSELAGLVSLSAGNKEIEDISVLQYCTNLTALSLYSNLISDISPLEGLTNLTELNLRSNEISDISPLGGLSSLTILDLGDNEIGDISPLDGLTDLFRLRLDNNQISDVSPLVQNQALDEGDGVRLQGNPLSDTSINDYIPELRARGAFITVQEGLVPLDEIHSSLLEAFPEVIEEYPDGVPWDVLQEMEARMSL